MKYIVLWVKGGRVGSIELNKFNLDYLNKQLRLNLIQTDISGTMHLNVMGIK